MRLGQIRRHTTETSRAGAQRSPRSRLFRPSGPMRKPEHLLVGPAARPGRIPERTAPLSPQAKKAVPTRHLRLPCPPLRAWAFGLVEFSWKYYTRKPPLPLEHWRQSWALRLTSPRYRGPHACDAETLFLDRRTRAAPQVRLLSAQVPILEVGRKTSRVHILPTQVNRKTDLSLSASKHQGGALLVKILFQPWFHLHIARKILSFYA